MLGRALDATFRNFSTLFLAAAVLFVPLHLGHAFVYRNVIAVAELRADIEAFPEGRRVRNVGPPQLDAERKSLVIVLIVEALLLVPIAGAARRVLEVDRSGEVPTVLDSWSRSSIRGTWDVAAGIGGAIVGAAMALLVYRIGGFLGESAGDGIAWIPVGLTRGVAVAAFAAVFTGCVVAGASEARRKPPVELDVY